MEYLQYLLNSTYKTKIAEVVLNLIINGIPSILLLICVIVMDL